MTASGQTEADRRALRRRQRELHSDIVSGANDKGNGEDGEEELNRIRDQNNALWDDVHYTREAVLDSENIDLIASKAARQAEKIVQVSCYILFNNMVGEDLGGEDWGGGRHWFYSAMIHDEF